MKKKYILVDFMCCLFVVILSGCGGGGGGSENPVTAEQNNAPVINSIDVAPGTKVSPSATVKLTSNATDADSDALTYNWTATGGMLSGTGAQVKWAAPSTTGTYTITVNVSDGKTSTAQTSTLQIAEISAELKGIQDSITTQDANWAAGETSASALPEEDREKLLGLIREDTGQRVAPKVLSDVPGSFDWRNKDGKDWTTSIKDQGLCTSCVAFASAAVVETLKKISGITSIDLSESHLFSCAGGACTSGMTPSQALSFLQSTGVADEPCLPYQPSANLCSNKCSDWQSRANTIFTWEKLPSDRTTIKSYLLKGPLFAGMGLYEDFLSFQSGVYKHVTGILKGYHAVMLVGYNDAGQYWIAKNSWGTSWGENGWFKIAYGDSEIEKIVYALTIANSTVEVQW